MEDRNSKNFLKKFYVDNSNPNNSQSFSHLDDLYQRFFEMYNHNSKKFFIKSETREMVDWLTTLRTRMDQLHYNDSRYLLRRLLPTLVELFNRLISNRENENYQLKVAILDIFQRIILDDQLIENYQQILGLVPLIIKTEREELGIKALKINLEYYKHLKQNLGFLCVERFMDIVKIIWENYDQIVVQNFDIIKREQLANNNIKVMAIASFKIISEIIGILIYILNLFSENVSQTIHNLLPSFINILRKLEPNPFRNCDYDPYRKVQIGLYEDYLYCITKIEYFLAFLMKVDNHSQTFLIRHGDDIIKALIYVLDNLQKNNFATRKEVLAITKSIIKPLAHQFYEKNEYFKNDENLLGKNQLAYDSLYMEVSKIHLTLIETISDKLNFFQKASFVEDFIMKINNYKIGYEFKFYYFYYIYTLITTMNSSIPQDASNPNREIIINLNNSILRETTYFLETMQKIFNRAENYFNIDPSDKKKRNEYLEKFFFETGNPDEELEESKPDMNLINKSNTFRIYELIISNEYEKYVNVEEPKYLHEILRQIIQILKFCVTQIQSEFTGHFHHQMEISQKLNNIGQTNQIRNTQNIQGVSGSFPTGQNPLLNQNRIFMQSSSTNELFNSNITQKSLLLRKLFKSSIKIYERLFKNHAHNSSEDNLGKNFYENLIYIFLYLPYPLCLIVFQKLMPFIYKAILKNAKSCPNKNCLISSMIDTLFDVGRTHPPLDDNLKHLKKELFEIFLDFFFGKIHYIGNNLKIHDDLNDYTGNTSSMTVLINVYKALFRFLPVYSNDDKAKVKIINFLVNCLILTKNSKYFGNYIYVIRCLFKNLLNVANSNLNNTLQQQQFEFYKETIHLIYGIMKFLISIKENFPFLKEMLTEIILIFPIKFKYMIDYAKIVFPTLIDALNMNNEIIPIGLQYLECWMNALFHKPENVNPFLQNNISQMTTLLTSHLYKSYSISLNSLKLLSKLGGKSRNYMEDKYINPKTSPTNILVVDLKDKSSSKSIEFPIDNIIDLCIKIVTNYKRHYDKEWINQIRTSFKTLKSCFLTFIFGKVEEEKLQEIITEIKDKVSEFNLEDFETEDYFKKMSIHEDQIKCNIIYRKAEHFLVDKLLRGIFLCCTIQDIEDEIKDFVKYVCDYFTTIMIIKNNNNRYCKLFEIDPTIILDIICEFVFSTNPTIFKNNNQTCISVAIKIVNLIIDTIENLFDKKYDLIEKLEIIDIIFMKFLNSCYNNEWSKRGGGLVIILILIKRFSKRIISKYLKEIIRVVFLVSNNYSSVVKIKYEVEFQLIIKQLIHLFLNFDKKNLDKAIESNNENKNELSIEEQKNLFFNILLFFHEEILKNYNSTSDYTRKICQFTYNQIKENSVFLHNTELFILIDIYKNHQDLFFEKLNQDFPDNYFMKNSSITTYNLTQNIEKNSPNNNTNSNFKEEKMKIDLENKDILFSKKVLEYMQKLTIKLELNSSNYNSLISNSYALNHIIKIKPELFVDLICSNQENFELLLKVLKNLFGILICDMYLYLEVTRKIHEIQFNSKFKYFFLEKFYSTNTLQFNLTITTSDNRSETKDLENDVSDETIEEIIKYIFNQQHNFIFDQHYQNNTNYSPIDPFVAEIFPILSQKNKMMKLFIKTLKNMLSNKILLEKLKHNYPSNTNINTNQTQIPEIINLSIPPTFIANTNNNDGNGEQKNFTPIILNITNDSTCNINKNILKNDFRIKPDSIERFFEIKNKCTNLLLRFIIYREEKYLLKAAKKFIRKLLKIETNTKNLLPEEELKKCIKPLLEQVATSRLNSFKIVDSLAILIKLLSSNFNDTLAKRLYDHISRTDHINNPNMIGPNMNPVSDLLNYDNSFNHAIISLLSHMKPLQIKDLFDNIVAIILKLEADINIKGRNYSIFNSKFKNKIIKLFSNFTDNIWELLKKEKFLDINNYYFFKRLIREDMSYVIRDNLAKNYKDFFINFDESNVTLEYLQKVRIFKLIVKKSPSILKENTNLINHISKHVEKYSDFSRRFNPDKLRYLDEILKNFTRILMFYSTKFQKLNYPIFILIIYKKRTFINRVKEKIKFFCFKNINEKMKEKRADKILQIFIKNFKKFKNMNCLDKIIKFIINPLIVKFYSQNKRIFYLDKNYKELIKLINEEENIYSISSPGNAQVLAHLADDSTKMEIIKLFILLLINFYLPRKNDLTREELIDISNFMKNKINNYTYGSSIYNYFLHSIFHQFNGNRENIINESLENINSLFFKHTTADQFNLINLCSDIFISSCLHTKPEEIIQFLKRTMAEKNINITQSFLLFSIILRYPDYFQTYKNVISSCIISFNIKILSAQTINAPTYQKKMSIQLLGLVIKWLFLDTKDIPSENRMKENCLLLLTKYYKTSLLHQSADGDYIDLARRHLLYIKELIKNNDFSIKKFLIESENESTNQSLKIFLNAYLFLLKIAILYCKKDSILQNIDHFFFLIKQIYVEPKANVKATNDATLIIRIVLSEKLLNQLNTHREKYDAETRLSADFTIIKNIKESFDQNWKTFDKKKNKLIIDYEFDQIIYQDFKNPDIYKKVISLFRNRQMNAIAYDTLFEIYPHFDFRFYFILYFYLLDENITVDKLPSNKSMIEDVLKLNENLKKGFFENWFIFTMICIQFLKEDEKSRDLLFETSRTSDYYSGNFFFLYNFMSTENLEKLKKPKQPQNLNFEKKFPIWDIVTESLLMGFYLVFSNRALMQSYKSQILKLCFTLIETYQQIVEEKIEEKRKNSGGSLINQQLSSQQCYLLLLIEYKVQMVFDCKFLNHHEMNSFILDFMKIYDYTNKKIQAGQSLKLSLTNINRTMEYIENYKYEYDGNIKEILKVLMFCSKSYEYEIRKRIFELFEKFNGATIFNKLKWIFQIENNLNIEIDNSSWFPYSVDLILYHFQLNDKIKRKEYCSKLRNLIADKSIENKVEKKEYIEDVEMRIINQGKIINNLSIKISALGWIEPFNKEIEDSKIENIIVPIREIVLSDITISQKLWFSIFPQVWRILSKSEQELMAVYINDFMKTITNIPVGPRIALIVKSLLEAFANCYPLIRIEPEILYVLAKIHSTWNSVSFYLEKLIISNIYRERSFFCLSKIYDSLKESEHNIGLKRFITNNRESLNGLANLQTSNFYKAEEDFSRAFKTHKEKLEKLDFKSLIKINNLNTIDLDNLIDRNIYSNNIYQKNMSSKINYSESNRLLSTTDSNLESLNLNDLISNLDCEDIPDQIDLSIWESGLVECYRNTNNWNNLLQLSEVTNNIETKIESYWHMEKWKEIEDLNISKLYYLSKLNQIYSIMKLDNSRNDNSYQSKCMDCIRTIFHDFTTFPANFEKLNYHYFLILQLIVEAWESTNTLKEIEKNILESKIPDFRENLIMWRDRIPHICEGFHSLKSLLDPRNYLFKILRDLLQHNIQNPNMRLPNMNMKNIMPNISDHIWNNMIFIKYARKLNLINVYHEYNAKFNSSINDLENLYPIEIFMKNMENFKFIRKITKNYQEGLKLADELCQKYTQNVYSHQNLNQLPGMNQNSLRNEFPEKEEIDAEINASYLGMKGYFLYRMGKIRDAHECFNKAVDLNRTDYSLYLDWADMSEKVLFTLKGTKLEKTWFENSLINYFMTIVFKLDKAKTIIPKVFYLIKKFPNQLIGSNFAKHSENIPTWLWIFWIPQIFEMLKTLLINPQNSLILNILKKLSITYPQYVYYQLLILLNSNLKDFYNLKNEEEVKLIRKHLEDLKKLILEMDKQNESIKKIDIIIDEINKKMEKNFDDIILNHLTNFLNFRNSKKIEEGINIINRYINHLKSINESIRGEYTKKIFEEFEILFKEGNFDLYNLYEKIKNWRFFINTKRATGSNFKDINQILERSLCNSNFEEVEIPGFFTNKIQEPTSDNRVYISRFESEFNFKFINSAHKKLIIRGSNEKLYSFKITNEIFGKDNSDIRIAQLQVLLNFMFAANKDTYKSNVKFNLPIRFQITSFNKIIQEDSSYYYLDEVFDFCMQKMGYDPELSCQIYHQEFKKLFPNILCENIENPLVNREVYYRMTEIFPIYKLKNFIHKFIINCDEIFIFRKQFATSYALNNLMSNIFRIQDDLYLDKISFNKETGSMTFHAMKYFKIENLSLLISNPPGVNSINLNNNLLSQNASTIGVHNKKDMIPFRLSKNINYFLSPACVNGIFSGCIYYAANALLLKTNYFENILYLTMFDEKKFKEIDEANVSNTNSLLHNKNILCLTDVIERIIRELRYICSRDSEDNPLFNIMESIKYSKSDEQLSKMSSFWNPWF